jgi:uncharacterized repeat protein (TIGR01451 family)
VAGDTFDHTSEARAQATIPGVVRGLSTTGGADAGPNPVQLDIEANSRALQTTTWTVTGVPPGTPVPIDVTVSVRGFLETLNFGGAPPYSELLTAFVRAQLTLTSDTQTVTGEATARLGPLVGMPPVMVPTPLDVTGPWQFTRVTVHPHEYWEVDFSGTLVGPFTVEAGEVFAVEAVLETSTYAHAPFEIFSTADFLNGTNGLTFALAAQGATIVPAPPANFDLQVILTDSPDPAVTGGDLTYTLTVTNNGPDPASGATVTHTLPPGVEVVSAPGGQTPVNGVLTYGLGTLFPSASQTLTVVVRPTTPGVLSSSASASAVGTDIDPGNNTASAQTTVDQGVADLVVTIDGPDGPMRADQPIDYTITVTNHGPDRATGVELIVASTEGFLVYSSMAGQVSPNRERIDINLHELASGASVTIQMTYYTRPDWVGLGYNQVSAWVTADQVDLTPDDNVDHEETPLSAPPPPLYDFTMIAEEHTAPPSLNNAGTVAYHLRTD